MKFSEAIDLFIRDMRMEGRINSDSTERNYRITLNAHADDVQERDPRSTFKDDVKRTLARWPHPNTRRKNRSILASFYDWTMQELEPGRDNNPARQTRPPKARPTTVYRMTREEVIRYLSAATTRRERRVAYLGTLAGIRNHELRHLQRRHFERPGWVHISKDIGKGGRERWVPVLPELAPVVAEILQNVGPTVWERPSDHHPEGRWIGEFILPAERWRDPGHNTERVDLKLVPASRQVLRTVVMTLGERAGIFAHITPHLMRHAFGDHIARFAGIKNAQALLGHADVGTTQLYTGAPTLDELAAAVSGFMFEPEGTLVRFVGRETREARTGIEPVGAPARPVEPKPEDPDPLLDRLRRDFARLQPTIDIYADTLGGGR